MKRGTHLLPALLLAVLIGLLAPRIAGAQAESVRVDGSPMFVFTTHRALSLLDAYGRGRYVRSELAAISERPQSTYTGGQLVLERRSVSAAITASR